MAEGTIYVGSRLRVELPAVDLTAEGEEAFDPIDLSVTVVKPDGSEVAATVEEEDGIAYIEFEEGDLDMPGIWTIRADEGGYKARISFRVHR